MNITSIGTNYAALRSSRSFGLKASSTNNYPFNNITTWTGASLPFLSKEIVKLEKNIKKISDVNNEEYQRLTLLHKKYSTIKRYIEQYGIFVEYPNSFEK